jgi:hypothetical protein
MHRSVNFDVQTLAGKLMELKETGMDKRLPDFKKRD